MKKITFLFSLCLMFFIGATTANAEIGDEMDRSTWTVKASSWCWDSNTEGSYEQAIDGVTNFWHSNWRGGDATEYGAGGGSGLTTYPEYLIIDLGEVKTNIGGFGYKSRNTNNANGNIKDYKIYVSTEPFSIEAPATTNDAKAAVLSLSDDNLVCSGTFTPNAGELNKTATSTAVSGQYILFVALSSEGADPNKWANCDEFYVYEYTNDIKPTLIEKRDAFQTSVTAAESFIGENPGYYKQSTIDAANAAITAATTVIDNTASTDAEEAEALTALETAISAFAINPVVSGIYKIVCGYPEYYNQQGVEKAIYASSNTVFAWGNLDENGKNHYWNVNVDAEGNVTIQNAAYGTWVNGLGTLSEAAAAVTCSSVGSGQFNLICGGTFHTNNHSTGAGIGSNIVSWGGGANTASSWKFVAVDAIPEYAENAWVWKDLDMDKPLYAGKRVSTLENGKQYFIYNTCMPSGQNRTGFIYSTGSGLSLDTTTPSELKLTRNAQVGYLWTVETTETEGVYRLKTYEGTYVQGKYINIKGAHSATATTAQDIYITDFSAETPVGKADVGSRAQDEETTVANADISTDDKVWAIYNNVSFSGNDQTWNGNVGSFATWASAHPYAFYEVHEAMDVAMSAASAGIDGEDAANVQTIATFSATHPTVVPEGVTAYYAAEDPASNVLRLVTVEGAIPANQGVILTGNDAALTGIELLPANKHAVADLSDNKLLNSADAAKTLSAANGDYVLTSKNSVIAFYPADGTLAKNKAYLNLSGSSAPAFILNFGGETTGIESVEAENGTQTVFDLSGRRVQKAQKGLYIINGKKVLVK